jgi:hypothetical protein
MISGDEVLSKTDRSNLEWSYYLLMLGGSVPFTLAFAAMLVWNVTENHRLAESHQDYILATLLGMMAWFAVAGVGLYYSGYLIGIPFVVIPIHVWVAFRAYRGWRLLQLDKYVS